MSDKGQPLSPTTSAPTPTPTLGTSTSAPPLHVLRPPIAQTGRIMAAPAAVAAMTPPEEVNAGLTAVGFMPGQAQAVTGLIGMLRTAIAGLSDFVHEQFAVVQADLNQLRGALRAPKRRTMKCR